MELPRQRGERARSRRAIQERFQSDSRAIRIRRGDSARLALGFQSDSSATTVPLYNINVLDDIFLGVSGHRRGDGLEFYHALVLLLRVLVVTEGRPGKSLEFYYALVLFLVLLVVTEVGHGKILDTRLPLQRSVHTGTWERVPSPHSRGDCRLNFQTQMQKWSQI